MNNTEALYQNILNQPQTLAQVIDYQQGAGQAALMQAAEYLRATSSPVLFSGMGSSYQVCIPAVKQLTQKGKAAALLSASELLHYEYPAYRNQVVVLVSRSGESVEVIEALRRLKAQGCTIIGLTEKPESTLAREAAVALYLNNQPDRVIAIQSHTAALMTLLLLAETVLGQASPWGTLPQLVAESIQHFAEISPGWQSFFEGVEVVYVIARGPSLAAAENGALLLHEVAKLPAIAMEAGQFRHGPVEAVTRPAGLRLIVLAPPDQTQALNLNLVDDLLSLGVQLRYIGLPLPRKEPFCWSLPLVAEPLQRVLEIVPLQFAAYHLALWRGIEAGKLLVAPQVTTSETGFVRTGGASG